MSIHHIKSPGLFGADMLSSAGSPPNPAGGEPVKLSKRDGFVAPDGSVETGTWESTPGQFRRAVMDAEFSHFIAGRATFRADDGQVLEFAAGDCAYFPPFSRGTWIIHETLRKTYVVWRRLHESPATSPGG
jgi:uncharacterized cupin superfamily protein